MIKTILGIILWVVLGYIVFIAFSAVGFMMAVIGATYAWWQIALGTVAGMIIVMVHLLEDGGDK